MTLGLSKDIQCHVWSYSFLCLQITKLDIRPHIKWAVNLVIAYDWLHLIFLRSLCRYVWVTPPSLPPPPTPTKKGCEWSVAFFSWRWPCSGGSSYTITCNCEVFMVSILLQNIFLRMIQKTQDIYYILHKKTQKVAVFFCMLKTLKYKASENLALFCSQSKCSAYLTSDIWFCVSYFWSSLYIWLHSVGTFYPSLADLQHNVQDTKHLLN